MKDSITKTFTVAALLAIVCAIIVSFASVSLKERQKQNKALDTQTNILRAAGLVGPSEKVSAAKAEELMARSAAVVVDMTTGEIAADANADEVQNDKTNVLTLDKADDVAGIKTIPQKQVVYVFYGDDGAPQTLLLPIVGTGLWSTMYGFLSLESDATTVAHLVFYDHGETPGLGGEISNPAWTAKWEGKSTIDATGAAALRVVKGTVAADDPNAANMVDGISGATLTGNGVTNTMAFWLGEKGYGPFLQKLRSGEATLPALGAAASNVSEPAAETAN